MSRESHDTSHMTPSVYLMKCYISEPVVVVLIGCDAMWQIKPTIEMKKEFLQCFITFTFSHFRRRFYPKQLTYVRLTMYTHFTFTLMAHCTSGAIRGSVSCSRTLRQGIELATFRLLNDFFTSCTTVHSSFHS